MKDEIRKNLIDIIQAGEEIRQFTHDMDFKTYRNSPITQRAVERNFEIIGEALNRIKRMDDKSSQACQGITGSSDSGIF